ncbi:DrmE family protein [Bradyrhizobium sp.]|uniref:DrmE family protein n=1 Tax=Bradyrhizobium sp. TaxID=376 RepID=UPI00262D4210|nr:DrmE family protein [Bradyrhizobium sp.]
MITLDPTQAAALRSAAIESVAVDGADGTGKSTLAMAIATQAVAAGRSCLLIGRSAALEKPSPFRMLVQVHPVLFERAHHQVSAAPDKPVVGRADPLGARANADPFAARTALALLRRVRNLSQTHGLTAAEIEEAGAANPPSEATRDLAGVVLEDATKLADQLWSGNARSGRSLADVAQILESGASEVPPNERAQALLSADDVQFELQLGRMRAARREERDEQLASAVVSRLKRSVNTEKTVAEYRQHADWMARVMADAIDLVRKHGNLQAAVQAQPDADGAKAVEYFIRMRPREGASDALRQFQAALRDYQQDGRSLEPMLRRFGSRTLQSLQASEINEPIPSSNPTEFSQRIREARSASRSLPSRLAQLRSRLSPAMVDRLEKSPVESALTILDQAGSPTLRERSADEARQLRQLFTQTGFGDPLEAPPDFEARVEAALSSAPAVSISSDRASSHHPPVLDLLLDVVDFKAGGRFDAWPSAVVRARTVEDVAQVAAAGGKFDVVVVDDAEDFVSEEAAIAACSAVVHRIGRSGGEGAFSLRTPHLQKDAELADAALGQPGRWLGSPDSVGVIVRTVPRLSVGELEVLAGKLAKNLQEAGFDTAASSSDAAVDFLVTGVAELTDENLPPLARRAKKGLIVLCHSDQRNRLERKAETKAAIQAESLGWQVLQSALEGTVIEKGGRVAVIVEEPRVLDDRTDATVAYTTTRLAEMGWRPVVDWVGTERDPDEYARLLEERAIGRDNRLLSIVRAFDPSPPPVEPDDTPPDGTRRDVETPPAFSIDTPVDQEPSLQTALESAASCATEAPAAAAVETHEPDADEVVIPAFPEAAAAAPCSEPTRLRKVRVAPKLLDGMRLSVDGQKIVLPHVARLVAATALNTEYADPICIILPSVDRVAQFTAITAALECLAVDFENGRAQFIERYFTPGARVRSLPEGYVFFVGAKTKVHDTDGTYLGFADKETQVGDGKRLVPNSQLFWYEPTQRQLPKSNPTIRPKAPPLTKVDELAGVGCCGNSGLYTNRVLLVGARAEFDRVLESLDLESASAESEKGWGRLSDTFAWGTFDDSGKPISLSPEGAGGSPLVAIARDLFELERASLAASVEPGSQIILTDRLDMILKDVELANRVGERQRLILLVDARRRGDALQLRRHGWKVWEPTPNELVDDKDDVGIRTGIPGLDRTRHSSLAERRPAFSYMPKSAPHLGSAYAKLGEISDILNSEAVVDDERFQAIGDAVRSTFFQASSWLAPPKGERLYAFEAVLRRLRDERGHVTRFLGKSAAETLDSFVEDVENFALVCVDGGVTPKGDALLQLAKDATNPARKQVLVTGSRQSREEADEFLAANGISLQCRLASELADGEYSPDVISFSLLRRDMFEKFIDPWPSKAIVMAGYDFEVDIYRRRMRWRASQKRRLEVDASVRATLTTLPSSAFGPPRFGAVSEDLGPVADEATLDPIDRIWAAGRDSRRPIQIRELEHDEHSEDAQIVRFVGRSWMPMAADYRPVCLLQAGNDRSKSGVEYVEVADLKPGMRIIVREGGEKDVIKAIAQQSCGQERYDRLWEKASLWRDALREWGTDAGRIARKLQDCGLQRHIVTLRSWVTNRNLIGPRSEDDVLAIARAFPSEARTVADWKDCWNAISELRGHHLSAGMRLTNDLVARCGRMLLEPSENETAVEFDLGTVWILEVAEVEPGHRSCPAGIVNRLQWTNSAWQDRMFDERLKVMAA